MKGYSRTLFKSYLDTIHSYEMQNQFFFVKCLAYIIGEDVLDIDTTLKYFFSKYSQFIA